MDVYLFNTVLYFERKLGFPAQTPKEIGLFRKVFKSYAGKRFRVFEWGSGNSTIYYGRYLASMGCDFEWHAIDNSRQWKEHVASLINRHGLSDRIHLHLSEFPAFWELPGWSWKQRDIPKDICCPEVVEYVECPRKLMETDGFDIVIVDGRFRRRCLLLAPDILAPGGIVLLHDAQKDHYHGPLENYQHRRFFDAGRLPGSNVKTKTWIGSNDPSSIIEKYTP
jgi:hypothetical protein